MRGDISLSIVSKTTVPMPLGKSFTIWADYQGNMIELGGGPAKGGIELELTKSTRQQIVTPHNFGDLHGVVIDNDSELVSRVSLLLGDHKVPQFCTHLTGLRSKITVDE